MDAREGSIIKLCVVLFCNNIRNVDSTSVL